MTSIEIPCINCGDLFVAEGNQATRRKYCSTRCKMSYIRANPTKKNSVEITCESCGEKFLVVRTGDWKTRRFCSNPCRGAWFNGERSPHWDQVVKTCESCGDPFSVIRAREDKARFCSKACMTAHMRGENAQHYKGGRFADAEGYIRILLPDHPNAFASGYAHEHVVVASANIGRALGPDEVAHHDNEVKEDNRPENIQVLTRADHMRLHLARKHGRSYTPNVITS